MASAAPTSCTSRSILPTRTASTRRPSIPPTAKLTCWRAPTVAALGLPMERGDETPARRHGLSMETVVTNGLSLFAVLTSFGAGIISFLSPCVLPLVPGYVSYIAGQPLDGSAPVAIARGGFPALRLSAFFVLG